MSHRGDFCIFVRDERRGAADRALAALLAAGFDQVRVAVREMAGEDLAWPERYASPRHAVIEDDQGGELVGMDAEDLDELDDPERY
jgi:hypothetical protein